MSSCQKKDTTKEALEYLLIENEYLKKLEALVQEKEKSLKKEKWTNREVFKKRSHRLGGAYLFMSEVKEVKKQVDRLRQEVEDLTHLIENMAEVMHLMTKQNVKVSKAIVGLEPSLSDELLPDNKERRRSH